MKLELPTQLAESYKNKSQIARVITESWVAENAYCPNCGQIYLSHFENNRPVADFFCANCREEFESKSKQTNFSTIINDGAYDTMIHRLESENNPMGFRSFTIYCVVAAGASGLGNNSLYYRF